MPKKFFLIDGHSHLYRAFYAVRGLTTPDGRPTNAVYGFITMLRKLVRDFSPDYLAVAFDMPGKTFRHDLFTEYKATRMKPPDEFVSQIPLIREVLEAMRIPMYGKPGFEADDVMGTIALKVAKEKGMEVYLVTGDKDAGQLLRENIFVLDTGKDQLLTVEKLRERDGISPEQVLDVMALSGDASDNVPGVPRVGLKTALMLIKEFGSLDNLLAHIDDIKRKALADAIRDHVEQARLSKTLVTLDNEVPIDFSLEDCRLHPEEPARLRPLYQRLDFKQLLAEFVQEPTREETKYALVDTQEAFDRLLSLLRDQSKCAFDLETTSQFPMLAKICGMSFSWKKLEGWYIPLRAPEGERVLDTKMVLSALKPILENEKVGKVGQNLKYDAIVLRNNGVEMRGIIFDTMVAAYLLNAERRRYGLDELASEYLNYHMIPISDLIGKGKKQITMDLVPARRVCDYCCADSDVAMRLSDLLENGLKTQGMYDLFLNVEMPLVPVLAEMEYHGIALDCDALKATSQRLEQDMLKLEKQIYVEAGEEFNIGSTKQLSSILFEKLRLPRGRKTKSGSSTDSEVLDELAIAHRLPRLVLEYRQMSKLKSTYADALPILVSPVTKRLHTSFNQTVTSTGRLSSSDPNLQNIPIRTELGEKIRCAFIPGDPLNKLLTADYSQIELRIVAHICGDPELRKAFVDGVDIHTFVAAQINGIDQDKVTPVMRRAAKTVNFGIIYGLSAYGLSKELKISTEEAATFIKNYFSRYPGVKAFIDKTIVEARKNGFVTTLLGRRRPLPGLIDPNHAVRSFAERAAVNAVIQGTAADMIKIAMIRISRRLKESRMKTKMLLQIHDELLFEVTPEEEAAATKMISEEMTTALKMDVPVKVNIAAGKNWMDAK